MLSEPVLLLLGIQKTMGYDDSGNPTGKYVGYSLSCVELTNFNRLRVKIPDVELEISADELKAANDSGERTFIELEKGFIKPYFNGKTKTIEDSITAETFHLVDRKNV